MSDLLQVELVAADRLVWSGEAKQIIARTTEGDLGVLPGHAPLMSILVPGVVDVQTAEGETWIGALDGGFISVADNHVRVLSDTLEVSHEIDLEAARREVEEHRKAGADDEEALEHLRRAEARVRAAEQAN